MSEYPKIIERPYKMYTGEQEYIDNGGREAIRAEISWTYRHSFELESDAVAYANRAAEDFEFVKIEEKEKENN